MRVVHGVGLLAVGMGVLMGADARPKAPKAPKPLRVLYVKGLYHLTLDLEPGIRDLARTTRRRPEIASVYYEWDYHRKSPRLVGFPKAPSDLGAYDVVILANVDAAALGDAGMRALSDYVNTGGGLLVIGGLFAYGRGAYQGTALEAVLPVTVVRFHDLRRCEPDSTIAPCAGRPFAAGIDWSARPVCPYMHEVKPKAGASVVLTCNGQPLLVLGKAGRGRVGAFMGTALGDPPPGRQAFWQWPGWPDLIARQVRWLQGGP